MQKSKSKPNLGIIIFLFIAGIVSFWLGLESVRESSILGENHPPIIFFICIQAFCFITGGVFLGKFLTIRKKSKNKSE